MFRSYHPSKSPTEPRADGRQRSKVGVEPTPNGHRGCQYNVWVDPDLDSHRLVGDRISSNTLAWVESHPLNYSRHRLCARAGVAVELYPDSQC